MSGRAYNKRLGSWGEALTAEYLRRAGYKLLVTGYRCQMGEIDLIARRGNVLAFVEVKTRRNDRFGQGREAVDRRKQARIYAAARHYLMEHPSEEAQLRFDVAEIFAPQGTATAGPEIHYLEDAFRVEEWTESYTPF